MSRLIFVNLAIKSAAASRAFFTSLGFGFNELFSDERTLCLEINDGASVMLLEEERFSDFLDGDAIVDTARTREVLLALSADSREAVDALVQQAIELGGQPWGKDQDLGFMYSKDFKDLDGHVWEVFWMDQSTAENGPEHT